MKSNPIRVAQRAKGSHALIRRARSITGRYGLTPAKMDQALGQFAHLLNRFGCCASFPITAAALKRSAKTIQKYAGKNIEFGIHGYTHIDYSQLPQEKLLQHLQLAREVFIEAGLPSVGFRSPYLSRSPSLNALLETAGFTYVSNQPVIWDALDSRSLAPSCKSEYERALEFYQPWSAQERTSLPAINSTLVEIPISLPDDEILVERLGAGTGLIKDVWQCILAQTYQNGELFTLMLHPERVALCADALSAILSDVCSVTPAIWCARLDQIASWWKARARMNIEITDMKDGGYHCRFTGLDNGTVLVKDLEIDAPSHPWMDGWRQADAREFTAYATTRPFIGLSPSTTPKFAEWLRQQGYIFEFSTEVNQYKCYFDRPDFSLDQERSTLVFIEKFDLPMVRIGQWPNGSRSALAITGDIDALTLWDYGLRMIGK